MKTVRQIVLLCVLPLMAGAIFYVIFRAHGIMGFSFGPPPLVKNRFLLVMTGVLPDFFWAFSLSSALYLYFLHNGWSLLKSSLVVLPLLLLSEVIQIWMPRYFTFDLWDLSATLAAVLLSAFYFKNQRS